jgi:hypothetical protein
MPEQNSSAEKENHTLMEAARSMLQTKEMLLKLWAEAENTATSVINRTGPTKTKGSTPYKLWTESKLKFLVLSVVYIFHYKTG